MDSIEYYRYKRPETFIDALHIKVDDTWKQFFKTMGVRVTEELRLLSDEEWEDHLKIVKLRIISERRLKAALSKLKTAGDGEYDAFIGRPLPIKDNTSRKDPPLPASSSSSSSSTPKRKKKRIESMGGNLIPVTKFFSPKKKQATASSNTRTSSSSSKDKNDQVLMIEAASPADWRLGRETYDTRDNLMKIKEPAEIHMNALWKKEDITDINNLTVLPSPSDPTNNNFEDYLGYYASLGENLSRTSSDDEIKNPFKQKKDQFRKDLLAAHPDKNNSVDGGTQKVTDVFNHARDAYNLFVSTTSSGVSGRLEYDLKCDTLILAWRNHVKYNDDGAREQLKVQETSEKRRKTNDMHCNSTNLEKCANLYNSDKKKGQTTEWKIAVYRAVNEEAKTPAEIARYIRKERGSSGWDGVFNGDKECNAIKQKIRRALDTLNSESFDLNKLESMSQKDASAVLKKKHTSTDTMKRSSAILGKQQQKLEDDLYSFIEDLWRDKKKVSRIIIFRKVIELDKLFKGGTNDPTFFKQMKVWFYNGFCRRKNLSYTRIAGASRKLPSDWKEKQQRIIRSVAKSQTPRKEGHTVIPAVTDSRMANTDHVPMYRDMVGAYSWTKKGAGGRGKRSLRGQIGTGGGEKDRFTVQLTCLKDGGKVKPFIIFKAAPANGVREFKTNTVAYELKNRLPDNAGNTYPPSDKVYLTCNKTANSNGAFTIEILREVIFPALGVFDGERAGMLVDDFKGHSKKEVKEYVKSFRGGNELLDEEEDMYDLIDFLIMAGGITPKSQPIDVIIGKIFKGFYRDDYDQYMLTAPTRNGHPITPSRQLCATWVVNAWEKIPSEIIKKAWILANYKSMEDLSRDTTYDNEIVEYSSEDIVKKICESIDDKASDDGTTIGHYLSPDNIYDDLEFEYDDE